MRRRCCALLALGALSACAQPKAPPGWNTPDRTPPQLVSTSPEQLAVVPAWKGPVVFRFDERISEKGVDDHTAIVSPDTGLARVKRHGSTIRVEPRDGWKPGRVYQVVLLPTVRDLFGNQRTAPVELVFSTGPAIVPTAIAGLVQDRLTGRPVAGALVQAMQLPDSLVYTTASDTSGFFAIRYVPVGRYVLRAFVDRNGDRHIDFREPQAQTSVALGAGQDTAIIPISRLLLLARDSTPARLVKVQPVDSLQVRLGLDDYLDPTVPLAGASATLWQLPDSTVVPVAGLYYPAQYDSLRRAASPDTGASARRPAAARDTAGRSLPVQELMLVPARPLAPRTRYRVRLHGIMNINDVADGGGSETFTTAAPLEPRPPAALDSAAARPAGAPADSSGRKPAGAPADSAGRKPAGAPADSAGRKPAGATAPAPGAAAGKAAARDTAPR